VRLRCVVEMSLVAAVLRATLQKALVVNESTACLLAGEGRCGVSLRWQRLQRAAMGLNCVRWSDGRWYSVCHVGPNDMR
jgi:hypothetical protein